MKLNQIDLSMIILSLISLIVWYFKDYSFPYGFIIFFLVFLYLYVQKSPISHYLIVILFSVISIRCNTGMFKLDCILVTILFIYTLLHNMKNKYIVYGNLFFIMIIYFLYNLLSISWTPVKIHGWLGLVAMVEGYQIYYILTNNYFKIEKTDLPKISIIATYLMITLSIEIFFTYYIDGFQLIIDSKDLGWVNPNLIAVIYVFLIPIALYKYIDQSKYYLGYFLMDLISFVGLIMTLSRGAIIGVVVSLLLYTIFYVRRYFITRYLSIGFLFTIFAYLIPKINYYFLVLKEKIFVKEYLDDHGRYSLYTFAFKMFKEKPLFGHGIKSSKYLIREYLGYPAVHFHNFILQIAVTLGIVGLIMLLIFFVKWSKILYKPKDSFVVVCSISIFGALTHQMVDVSFDLFYFGLYFYTIIGGVEIYRHHLKDDPIKLTIYKKKS